MSSQNYRVIGGGFFYFFDTDQDKKTWNLTYPGSDPPYFIYFYNLLATYKIK